MLDPRIGVVSLPKYVTLEGGGGGGGASGCGTLRLLDGELLCCSRVADAVDDSRTILLIPSKLFRISTVLAPTSPSSSLTGPGYAPRLPCSYG